MKRRWNFVNQRLPVPSWVRLLSFLFIIFFGLVLFWADQGSMPQLLFSLYNFPWGDKLGHFLVMGILSFLVVVNLPGYRVIFYSKSLPTGALVVGVLVVLEEISQVFFVTRTSSLADLLFSLLGVLTGSYLGDRQNIVI